MQKHRAWNSPTGSPVLRVVLAWSSRRVSRRRWVQLSLSWLSQLKDLFGVFLSWPPWLIAKIRETYAAECFWGALHLQIAALACTSWSAPSPKPLCKSAISALSWQFRCLLSKELFWTHLMATKTRLLRLSQRYSNFWYFLQRCRSVAHYFRQWRRLRQT